MRYSQRDVAELTDLTVNTVSALENGRGATMNNFLLICRSLQIQPRDIFAEDVDLTMDQELSPRSRRRLENTRRLEELVFNTDFFNTPKRVSEVLRELDLDRSLSNRYSVYLASYCKEGILEDIPEGNIKKYHKRKV